MLNIIVFCGVALKKNQSISQNSISYRLDSELFVIYRPSNKKIRYRKIRFQVDLKSERG